MKNTFLIILVVSFSAISSCTMDKVAPVIEDNNTNVCDSIPKTFAADVEPIFTNNCMGCHNPSTSEGGYDLTTHALISSNIDVCLKTMNHETGVVAMPYQQAALSDSLIQVIECWAADGAPNN